MKNDLELAAADLGSPTGLPASLVGLFNSYEFGSIDERRHASLIVKTVLSRGTWDQIMWLFQRYGQERIGDIFREDYFGLETLPGPTRRLWELLFVDEAQRNTSTGTDEWRSRRLAHLKDGPGADPRLSNDCVRPPE